MRVAIIKAHEWTEYRAIILPPTIPNELDSEGERKWIWPIIGQTYHLLDIVTIETLDEAARITAKKDPYLKLEAAFTGEKQHDRTPREPRSPERARARPSDV